MSKTIFGVLLGATIFVTSVVNAGETDIIINELHYHPPSDFGEEEYLELYNRGSEPVDLSGWAFSEGIFYTFPGGTVLEPEGFLLLAKNRALVEETFNPPVSVLGDYEGQLSDGGDTLTLYNANGLVVESIHYDDQPPWPTTPDAKGASLQRISPFESAAGPANWESGAVDAENRWTQVTLEGATTAQTLIFHLTKKSDILIDDVSLVKVGTAENLLQHPSFESNLWPVAWQRQGSHTPSRRLSVSNTPDGDFALRIESDLNQNAITQDRILQTVPQIEIGERYRLSFWLLTDDQEGELIVEIGDGFRHEQTLNLNSAFSPGMQNSVFLPNRPPYISEVQWTPRWPAPRDSVVTQARIQDPDGIENVELEWSLNRRNRPEWSAPQFQPMQLASGSAQDGVWRAELPQQADRTLVRFRIFAADGAGGQRIFPSPTESRNTETYFHFSDDVQAEIPVAFMFSNRSTDRERDFRGDTTLVIREPNQPGWQVFDHVIRTRRNNGWNINFLKHFEFKQASQLNVIFETKQTNGLTDMRYSLAEFLTYKVHEALGNPTPYVNHFRLFDNNELLGFHFVFEQPNKQFLDHNGIENSGDLYKIIWNFDRSLTRSNIVRQHEKKTNLSTGHDDVINTIQTLHRLEGQAQAVYIESHFAVDEFINYYVAAQLVQDWDGYFNNHFVYHDTEQSGLWYVFPWDKDKTWGDSDAFRNILPFYNWYDFPILYGAESTPQSGKHSGTWWRPPGFFSSQILDNPAIQRRYLHRLGFAAAEIFTEERWLPIINALEERLEPEVRIRAEMSSDNNADVMQLFHNNIESFRRQVTNRRAFILDEVEARIGPVTVKNWALY